MKVKTNLSNKELYKVALGLSKLSKSVKSYEPENPAEKVLLGEFNNIFDTVVNNLKDEFSSILRGN
jgi:hypothetical protein